jgi:ribosomal protein S18 acetylase RimI-like enzyme
MDFKELQVENFVVRPLLAEDADSIVEIYSAIIQGPVNPDFRQLIIHHGNQHNGACFVAEQNGTVVGFLISYILSLGFGIEKSAWIAILGVDPAFMGKGIGASMAEETYAYYRGKGIKRVYTSVRWDTTDLLSFFKTQGFEQSNHINLKKDL